VYSEQLIMTDQLMVWIFVKHALYPCWWWWWYHFTVNIQHMTLTLVFCFLYRSSCGLYGVEQPKELFRCRKKMKIIMIIDALLWSRKKIRAACTRLENNLWAPTIVGGPSGVWWPQWWRPSVWWPSGRRWRTTV